MTMTALHQRVELDPDCAARFAVLAEQITKTRRAMGKIVDESILESPSHIYHETIYELYADLYYQKTGDKVSPRTVRYWRDMAIKFTAHDIATFELLPDSILLEAVKLSDELASFANGHNATAQQICQFAMDNQISTVPDLRERILPSTYTGNERDPGWLSSLKRHAKGWPPHDDRWPTFRYHVGEIIKLIARK